jgi:hypothetical protein
LEENCEWHSESNRDRIKGRPPRQLPRVPTYNGSQDVTGIIRNTLLVNSGFHMPKNFSKKLSAIWACTLKKVQQPCFRLTKFKEYQF